jgi:DNA-binding NarL/FixJ family response regulator
MNKITVVVVDDHPLFRQGVVDSFSLEPDLLVAGQAANGEDAPALVRTLKPQIAVLDVNLPGLNGQQVMRQVVAEKLPTRVILLTAYDDQEQVVHAMRGGAAAYCSKDVQPENLIKTIRQVAEGQFIIDEQALTAKDLERWLEAHTEGTARLYGDLGEAYYPLSAREMEVLTFVTKGMSNKEIANILGISHQTVKNHVTSILRKLGVEDRTQAAIYALRRGWVRLYQQNSESQE